MCAFKTYIKSFNFINIFSRIEKIFFNFQKNIYKNKLLNECF